MKTKEKAGRWEGQGEHQSVAYFVTRSAPPSSVIRNHFVDGLCPAALYLACISSAGDKRNEQHFFTARIGMREESDACLLYTIHTIRAKEKRL